MKQLLCLGVATLMLLQACSKAEPPPPPKPVYSLQVKQADFAEFKSLALKLVQASDTITKMATTQLRRGDSKTLWYSICKEGRDTHRSFVVLVVPPSLADNVVVEEVRKKVSTVIAVRAAAFDNGVTAAQTGDVTKIVDMRERLERADIHAETAVAKLGEAEKELLAQR